MKLATLKVKGELPREAGGVPIVWNDNRRRPGVEDGNIILPGRLGGSEFFTLQGGKQFLFRRGLEKGRRDTWFCGMDEQYPFVTEIWPWNPVSVLKRQGEKAFYELLKPRLIADLEKEFPERRAGRQGDLWFFKLPWTWAEIEKAHNIITGVSINPRSVDRRPIFKTRHFITGRCADVVHFRRWWTICCFGEGTVTALHHQPVKLKGPHVIVRENLKD